MVEALVGFFVYFVTMQKHGFPPFHARYYLNAHHSIYILVARTGYLIAGIVFQMVQLEASDPVRSTHVLLGRKYQSLLLLHPRWFVPRQVLVLVHLCLW